MAKYGTFKYGEMSYGSETLWIYHRKKSDIINKTEIAYLNYWDLNRIETRMKEISKKLNGYAYRQTVIIKTDWGKQGSVNDRTNIPDLTHLIRLRTNIETLINSFFVYPTTPILPESFENLDVFRVNDIEKILHDLHYMVKSMESYFRECDTFECGE